MNDFQVYWEIHQLFLNNDLDAPFRSPDNQPFLEPLRADPQGPDGEEPEALPPRPGEGGERAGGEERAGEVPLSRLHPNHLHTAGRYGN